MTIYHKIMHNRENYGLAHSLATTRRNVFDEVGADYQALPPEWQTYIRVCNLWAKCWYNDDDPQLHGDDIKKVLVPGLHLMMGARQCGKSYIISCVDRIIDEEPQIISIGEPKAKFHFVGNIDDFVVKVINRAYDTEDDDQLNVLNNDSELIDPDDSSAGRQDTIGYREWVEWLIKSRDQWSSGERRYNVPKIVTLDSISSVLSSPNVTSGGYYPGGMPTALEDYMTYLDNAFATWNIVAIATFNPHDFKGDVPDFPGSISSTYMLEGTIKAEDGEPEDDVIGRIREHSRIWSYRYPRFASYGKPVESRYFGGDDMARGFFGETKSNVKTASDTVSSLPTISEKISALNATIRNNF